MPRTICKKLEFEFASLKCVSERTPSEHRNKDIVICICLGGDIQEQVRPSVEGFMKQNERNNITFEEWNGDRIASLILLGFLREDLLPQSARSLLRKSLALLDEPEASYKHFATLVRSLFNEDNIKGKDHLTVIRQINICLWILFAWARDAGNVESAYLSSELTLLYAWELTKTHQSKTTKNEREVQSAFESTLTIYQLISSHYLNKILPHIQKLHSLSVAVRSSCSLDVNLKLFDVLGRLSMGGIWLYWGIQSVHEDQPEVHGKLWNELHSIMIKVKQLILCNPVLLLPIKDDQVIDISIAILLLFIDSNNHSDIVGWLSQMVERASFAYQIHSYYPCNLQNYGELIDHPKSKEDSYFHEVTQGSVLFPMIALWAALLNDSKLYNSIQNIKEKYLSHSTFQFWYPDEDSEKYYYTNSDIHGSTLTNVCINRSMDEFADEAFAECEHSPHFKTLSAINSGLWPIILIACRHYRLPIPIHLWEGLRKT